MQHGRGQNSTKMFEEFLMAKGITNRQMVFILFLTLMAVSITDIARVMAKSAGTGAWFTIILSSAMYGLVGVIIVSLTTRFPNKMIFDYGQEIAGKAAVYIIAVFYIVYFALTLVIQVTQLTKMLQSDFLLLTPRWTTMLIGLPVFGAMAYKGVTSLARMAEFVGTIFVITGLIVQVFMITDSKIINILPLFEVSKVGNYLAAFKDTIFAFLGMEVLLVIPFTKENGGKKAKRTIFLSLLGIGLLYVFVVEGCIMKVGINDILHYNESLIVAIRDTEVPFLDFLQRMDILYLTVGFMGFFVGIGFAYIAALELLCKIFPKASRLLLCIVLGAVYYAGCIFVDPIPDFSEMIRNVDVGMGIIAAFLIPVALLLIAKVRKLGQKMD
jgi:spore germination protein